MKEKWQSSAAAISLSSSGICRHLSALFHPCQHFSKNAFQLQISSDLVQLGMAGAPPKILLSATATGPGQVLVTEKSGKLRAT